MYRILKKEQLNPNVFLLEITAPAVAKKARPGQFVILRVDERGERIPLTIAGFDRGAGTVRVIFQAVGLTTYKLAGLGEGDALADFVGPLGKASDLSGIQSAAIVGGGLGSAICYPLACALKEQGAEIDVIMGFRTAELVFLEEEFKALSNRFYLTTDDGSKGEKGFVTGPLERLLFERNYDVVYAVGPLPMMKNVAKLTKKYEQKTIVSMNPIMIDGRECAAAAAHRRRRSHPPASTVRSLMAMPSILMRRSPVPRCMSMRKRRLYAGSRGFEEKGEDARAAAGRADQKLFRGGAWL